jgi:predicted metalloprotease
MKLHKPSRPTTIRSRTVEVLLAVLASVVAMLATSCSSGPGANPANLQVWNCYGALVNAKSLSLSAYMTDLMCDVAKDWRERYQGIGKPFQPVPYEWIPSDQIDKAGGNCGWAGDPDVFGDSVSPAFACPDDRTIYISVSWIRNHAWNQGGAMAVGVVIAHETFHIIQFRQDITDPITSPDVSPTELQADCAAGVWAYDKYQDGQLEGNDIALASQLMSDLGDNEIGDPGHHGTPYQRSQAFLRGYNTGDIGKCTLDLPSKIPEYSS